MLKFHVIINIIPCHRILLPLDNKMDVTKMLIFQELLTCFSVCPDTRDESVPSCSTLSNNQ